MGIAFVRPPLHLSNHRSVPLFAMKKKFSILTLPLKPALAVGAAIALLSGGLIAQNDATNDDATNTAPAPKPAEPPIDDYADAIRSGGKITAVTLYQGTAQITRRVDIPADQQGAFELLVESLPTGTDPASVFADEATGVEVRSVTTRIHPTNEAELMQNQVTQLDRAIEGIEKSITDANNEIALRRIRQDFLKDLGGFVAPSARQEMTHGVLQAEELEKVTQMHFREYETASQEIMKLDFEIEDHQEELKELQGQRGKLAAGPPVTFDAIVYVDKKVAGPASLDLNYLVSDCGWNPIYNVRGDTENSQANVELNALIHQVSGEDWDNAQLTLSTASPTVSAYNPRLSPLYVQVSSDSDGASGSNETRYNQAVAERSLAAKGQLRARSLDETVDANFQANDSAASVQLIELSERLSALQQLDEGIGEDVSIHYSLEQPVTVVSRRDAQMVPVSNHQCAADFYHVAAPVLTPSVFREADLTNSSGQHFLGGQVNVYLDSEFIGRTDVPTIARGTRFRMGFGVDGQLRVRRSLTDRTDTVQGGNRHVTIACQLVIDSYKDTPIDLRISERTPHMEDAMSLRVGLENSTMPLSTDPDYLRFGRPKGILRWDLEVATGAGREATTLDYAYSLEFDKSQSLEDISTETKTRLRTEFREDLRKPRAKEKAGKAAQ